MPINSQKIAAILQECSADIEERYDGYRAETVSAALDILEYEREHRIMATRIVKKIDKRCSEAAKLLVQRDKEAAAAADAAKAAAAADEEVA